MIYLISRIDEQAHSHNIAIANIVSEVYNHKVFVPHLHNPYNIPHNKMEYKTFKTDLTKMRESSMGVIALPVGNDCSGEIGWFAGNNKAVIAIIKSTEYMSSADQIESLSSMWMIKGFIDEVVVFNEHDQLVLLNDPILKDKVTLWL